MKSWRRVLIFMWKFLLGLKSKLHSPTRPQCKWESFGLTIDLLPWHKETFALSWKTLDWLWVHAQHPAPSTGGFFFCWPGILNSVAAGLCPWRPATALARLWGLKQDLVAPPWPKAGITPAATGESGRPNPAVAAAIVLLFGFKVVVFHLPAAVFSRSQGSPGFPVAFLPIFDVAKGVWGLRTQKMAYDTQNLLAISWGLDDEFCGLFPSCLLPCPFKRELIFWRAYIDTLRFYTMLYWQEYHFYCAL